MLISPLLILDPKVLGNPVASVSKSGWLTTNMLLTEKIVF